MVGRVSRRAAAVTVIVLLAAASGGLSRVLDARASATPEGIDVSSFQGSSIAWHSVAASGISFAYIRAGDGEGSPNSADGDFGLNWRGAVAAGVTPGAYLFFEPSEDPVAQADLLISQLHSVGFTHGDLMPAIDVETTDGEPQAVVVANLRVMVDTVSAAIGSLPAIYAAPSWWNGNVDSSAFTLDPLWVANWGVSSPSVPAGNWGGTGWQVWQFSDAGSVPGIPGRVDLDEAGPRSLPYYGWPDPVALAATNVASTPQTVSDQPGDIDVLWRGTDDQIWTLNYRNGGWGTSATDISAAAGTPAELTTDPSVVSSGPGRIDAFWEGGDGNLWQSTYTAGWFGNGSWSAPRSLGLGPLGSEPEAVSPGPGLIDVFWSGVGGGLQVDRFSGGLWGGASLLYSGTVTGTPVAVSSAAGSDTVFWRGGTGDLLEDTGFSWGWSGTQQLTTTSLTAQPSASGSGGDIDVFWDSAGELWHGALDAGVWTSAAPLGTVAVEGNPAAVALAPGAVIVDSRESTGTLASALYTSATGLVGPEGLGATAGSDPSSVGFATGGAIDVVWRSATNGLWVAPACPGCAAPVVPVFSSGN
jgi:lysozyme